jgi:hypothetical protein
MFGGELKPPRINRFISTQGNHIIVITSRFRRS